MLENEDNLHVQHAINRSNLKKPLRLRWKRRRKVATGGNARQRWRVSLPRETKKATEIEEKKLAKRAQRKQRNGEGKCWRHKDDGNKRLRKRDSSSWRRSKDKWKLRKGDGEEHAVRASAEDALEKLSVIDDNTKDSEEVARVGLADVRTQMRQNARNRRTFGRVRSVDQISGLSVFTIPCTIKEEEKRRRT